MAAARNVSAAPRITRAALGAVARGKLSDAGGLAGAVHAEHQDHVRLAGEPETRSRLDALELGEDRRAQHAAHLRPRRPPAACVRTRREQALRRLHAEVGAEEQLLELVEQRRVEPASLRRAATRRPTSASLVRRRRSRRRAGAGATTGTGAATAAVSRAGASAGAAAIAGCAPARFRRAAARQIPSATSSADRGRGHPAGDRVLGGEGRDPVEPREQLALHGARRITARGARALRGLRYGAGIAGAPPPLAFGSLRASLAARRRDAKTPARRGRRRNADGGRARSTPPTRAPASRCSACWRC